MPMKKTDHLIMALHVTNRIRQAGSVQEILTRYGKHIKTRIGLHEADGRAASPNGLIVLEFIGSHKRLEAMKSDLDKIPGVEAQAVVFKH